MHKLGLCQSSPIPDWDITMNYSAKLWQASYSLSVVSESVGLLMETALPEMLYIPSMNPKDVIDASVKKGERGSKCANQNQQVRLASR